MLLLAENVKYSHNNKYNNKSSINYITLQLNMNLDQKSFVTKFYNFPDTFNIHYRYYVFISTCNT